MRAQTRQALEAINRRFYESQDADHFSATRNAPWPGWDRIAAEVQGRTVLDIGCGNGRLARHLHDRWQGDLDYLGLDASERLIGHGTRALGDARVRYRQLDFSREPLPPGRHGLVALFGVIHHVPDRDARVRLIQQAAERVAPGGLLAMSFWRFDRTDRFAGRKLTWEGTGLDEADLDPGDHLLRWGDQHAVRYCHFADDDEIARLTTPPATEAALDFLSDGSGGEMNRYVVLRATG